MATFVPFTHWLPVRAEQLEFGRSKKEGMPKTKKKRSRCSRHLQPLRWTRPCSRSTQSCQTQAENHREQSAIVRGATENLPVSLVVERRGGALDGAGERERAPGDGLRGQKYGALRCARTCALPCASSVSEHALAAVGTDVATLCSALDASETWAE